MHRGAARVLTSLVMLYLALDLTAPSMPGAFNFEIASSVEVVRLARDAEEERPALLPLPEAFAVERLEPGATQPARRQRAQVVVPVPAVRVSLARAALAPPPSEAG